MKDIKGYEGLYAVTSCGKVWSYRNQRFITQSDNGHGYLFVQLSKNGKVKKFKVHRLVAEAYIPNPLGKEDVAHLDDCRNHNWVSNLAWQTRSENLNTKSFKEKARQSKHVDRVLCVETGIEYESQAAAAREIGIHRYGINNVLCGKQHTAGGFHWRRI